MQKNEERPYEPAEYAFQKAPRCGAKLRNKDRYCRRPALRGRPRCFLHGCAPGSGGQPGNQNALKHGYYTAGAKINRLLYGSFSNRSKELLQSLLNT